MSSVKEHHWKHSLVDVFERRTINIQDVQDLIVAPPGLRRLLVKKNLQMQGRTTAEIYESEKDRSSCRSKVKQTAFPLTCTLSHTNKACIAPPGLKDSISPQPILNSPSCSNTKSIDLSLGLFFHAAMTQSISFLQLLLLWENFYGPAIKPLDPVLGK